MSTKPRNFIAYANTAIAAVLIAFRASASPLAELVESAAIIAGYVSLAVLLILLGSALSARASRSGASRKPGHSPRRLVILALIAVCVIVLANEELAMHARQSGIIAVNAVFGGVLVVPVLIGLLVASVKARRRRCLEAC